MREVLSQSGQKIYFREFKVLTFKIVCIFRYKYFFFWLNDFQNFNFNFSNTFGPYKDQFSVDINHYKNIHELLL